MLKLKSDASVAIQNVYKMIETKFACKIKIIRTDNGNEFNLKQLYSEKGIIHQITCVETPQQNAVVERKHQHVLNVARALRFQSGLPMLYWNDWVLTAIFLINRTPIPILDKQTPFEVLFKTKPCYSNLRVFCCLTFATTLAHNRHKFDSRARKCILLGYPFGNKGYKLLDLETGKIFISRNVVLHENIFPCKESSIKADNDLSNSTYKLPNPANSSYTEPSSVDLNYRVDSNFQPQIEPA